MRHKLSLFFNFYRLIIARMLFSCKKVNRLLSADMAKWCQYHTITNKTIYGRMGILLIYYKQFRNLFIHRLENNGKVLSSIVFKFLFRPLDSLIIQTKDIGEGFFIQHGFATIIAAKSIGKNFWVNQQVTIGYSHSKNPKIGDNVRVCCGGIVIGDVKVGNNSIVAAGAVVTKDIPDNEIWGGVPAKYIKSNN